MDTSNINNPFLGWSDNKDIKIRRKLNYDINLRHHDKNNIPLKFITGYGGINRSHATLLNK